MLWNRRRASRLRCDLIREPLNFCKSVCIKREIIFVKSGVITKKGRELVKLEIVPEEIEIVKYIFEKTVYDGYGTFRLSEEMNRRGIKTHAGAKFQPHSINRILRNKVYLGIFERSEKRSPVNESIRIITEKEYDEAQRIMAQRTNEMAKKGNIAYTTRGKALLSGNIFCKHCGSKMYGISYTDTYTTARGEKKVYKGIKVLLSEPSAETRRMRRNVAVFI